MTIDIDIFECRSGDILACDIINRNGVKLVSSGTTLNNYIIEKLKQFEIKNIKVIYPPEYIKKNQYSYAKFEYSYKKSIQLVKEIITELATGDTLNVDKVTTASELVYDHIKTNDVSMLLNFLDKIKVTDEYTYLHSINVSFYCMLLAKWINLSEYEIKKAIQAGLLHDIGKSRIPAKILNKPAKLNKEEFEVIKKHPIYGYDILCESDFADMDIKRAVLLHHERINSTGYPFGVSGDKITLLARIVSISDVYDAMTSNRVYKKKVTPFTTFEMFITEGYSGFDAFLTTEFINHMATYLIGSSIKLDNGEEGKIVYIPPNNILYPIVYSNGEYIDMKKSNIKIAEMI